MKQQLPQVSVGRPAKGVGMGSAGPSAPQGNASSFGLSDIAYIFYRHKTKILVCSAVGAVAAAAIAFKYRPDFVSDSKLMIRYVVDSRQGNPLDSTDQVRNPDSRGDNIINSEVELILSLDLAQEVARKVTPEKILKGIIKDGELAQMTPMQKEQVAAVTIRNRLGVAVKPKSNVIGVSFQHPEADVARAVLESLIGSEKQSEKSAVEKNASSEIIPGQYLKAHARVHRSLGLLKELESEAEKRKTALREAENSLKQKKERLRIVSVPEAKKAYTDQLARLRNEKLEAEANFAEAQASYRQITNSLAAARIATAPVTAAPVPAPVLTNTPAAVAPAPVPVVIQPEVLASFQGVTNRLFVLRMREQALLLQFLPTSPYVKRVSDQIAELNKERQKLIEATPALTNAPAMLAQVPAMDRQQYSQQYQQQPQQQQAGAHSSIDPILELAKLESLAAKVKILTEQLEQSEAIALDFAKEESSITQLEREILVLEKQYNYYLAAATEANVSDSTYSSKMSNISVLQFASPAYRATGALIKLLGGAAFGGIGLGVSLALLIEFITDRSVRRPKHVTDKLNIPLYLSVPKLDLPQGGTGPAGAGGPSAGDGGGDAEELNKFAEALRDRLIMHFQIKDVTHKPKLIGVTSCGRGAGVTTLATSLAASLSETGEGNVLYVDVNQQLKASAHPFRKGKPAVGISEVLGEGSRESALVSQNLYMVSLGDPSSNRVGVLPKKLANLVPEIRKSNYDYIIFDLPPVTQTSVAARVSGLMDTTVMVLESEKTQSELARQAVRLLEESNTELVAVLNKHKRYLPQSLETDL